MEWLVEPMNNFKDLIPSLNANCVGGLNQCTCSRGLIVCECTQGLQVSAD